MNNTTEETSRVPPHGYNGGGGGGGGSGVGGIGYREGIIKIVSDHCNKIISKTVSKRRVSFKE